MTARTRRIVPTLLVAPVLLVSVGACGTTEIDPKSGEKLVRQFVTQNGGTVKKASCPSGIKQQDGQFDCKVTVQGQSGATRSGTITVHLTQGGKHGEIRGPQDVHVQ
jgi:hypothetical protein